MKPQDRVQWELLDASKQGVEEGVVVHLEPFDDMMDEFGEPLGRMQVQRDDSTVVFLTPKVRGRGQFFFFLEDPASGTRGMVRWRVLPRSNAASN
jgi:hypothetical protein